MEEVRFLLELIDKYSPTGEIEPAREFLIEKMKEYGFNPRVLGKGAVVAEVGEGEGQGLILCGHLDTVEGKLPLRFDGRIISGRGVVDAKGALAAMIQALRKTAGKLPTKVFLVVSIDEEGESESTLEAIGGLLGKAYAAIVGEPSRSSGVTIAYHGKLDLELRCLERPRHPSASVKFDNSLEKTFEAYLTLKKEVIGRFGRMPVSPMKVEGEAEERNECRLNICLRYPPKILSGDILKVAAETVNKYGCKLKLVEKVEPYEIGEGSWLVKLFVKCMRLEGLNPKLIRKMGTCDMNLIGNELNVPVVAYGPGNPRLSHMDAERVLVRDYLHSIRVLERVLLGVGDRHGLNHD